LFRGSGAVKKEKELILYWQQSGRLGFGDGGMWPEKNMAGRRANCPRTLVSWGIAGKEWLSRQKFQTRQK